MTNIRCSQCGRKLAEVADGAMVTMAIVCGRCSVRNPITIPLDKQPTITR